MRWNTSAGGALATAVVLSIGLAAGPVAQSAEPVDALVSTGVGTEAEPVPILSAWAGRSGSSLASVWVTGSVYLPTPEPYAGQPLVLQELANGVWADVASSPLPATLDGGPVTFHLSGRGSTTLRVVFPAAGLVSPEMVVPGPPTTSRSRFYVRSFRGGGGEVLRVFKDGSVYAIRYGGMEYSCLVGAVSGRRLTLTTFDFGGGTDTRRTTGSWKTLKIKDPASRAVKGARKSLSGKYKRYLGLCADPTYAAVTTDPQGLP